MEKSSSSNVRLKIYEELARILTGRTDWDKFVQRIGESIERFIGEMVFEGLFKYANEVATPLRQTSTGFDEEHSSTSTTVYSQFMALLRSLRNTSSTS